MENDFEAVSYYDQQIFEIHYICVWDGFFFSTRGLNAHESPLRGLKIVPLFIPLKNPSGPSSPILTTVKALILRVRTLARIFRGNVENINVYMFLPLCSAPRRHSSPMCTAINALVLRVMHTKFGQNWPRTFLT